MDYIEIGLSFLEGLALVASPCILPVLPLVLAASIDGGRKRPFGIIFGFIVAFTAFAMLSRQIINNLGIDHNLIKVFSLALLTLFGLILLSEKLSAIFSSITRPFMNVGNNLMMHSKDGFFSGIFIGMLIGLIWTPCAGPILAAVLVQIIHQESNMQALYLIVAFSIGSALPMLIISLAGRRIMSKLQFLNHHAEILRKIFGILILIAVYFIASQVNVASFFKKEEVEITNFSGLHNALPNPYPAPEVTGIESWINSDPLTISSLKGKVVLIDFWNYTCINCFRAMPHLTKLDKTYRDKGLVIIGIHSPDSASKANIEDNVQHVLKKYNIEYPIAMDNKLDSWKAFKNKSWPTTYLIDKLGNVVYVHSGAENYKKTEDNIRNLLDANHDITAIEKSSIFGKNQTPKIYLGCSYGENFASPEPLVTGSVFSLPKFFPENSWALFGLWKIESDQITSSESGAKLQLNFTAKKVFVMLRSTSSKPITAILKLDGKPLDQFAGQDVVNSRIVVSGNKTYEVVNQDISKTGLLEITSSRPGLEVKVFVFSD